MSDAPPLAAYGWDEHAAAAWAEHRGEGREPARVAAEHRGGYVVLAARGELRADLSGKLRRAAAQDPLLRPAVGDTLSDLAEFDGFSGRPQNRVL